MSGFPAIEIDTKETFAFLRSMDDHFTEFKFEDLEGHFIVFGRTSARWETMNAETIVSEGLMLIKPGPQLKTCYMIKE